MPSAGQAARPLPMENRTAGIRRLLLVDDSPDDRAAIRRLLLNGSGQRYRFVEVETGAAAVQAVGDGPLPDCLVLDYNLPDMDAPEVMAALIGADGLTVCPVVVLTGSDGDAAGRVVMRAGAHDYVGKDGLTPRVLARTVETVIERWQMARDLAAKTAALRASEQRYRALVDATEAVTWSCPASGQQLTAQPAWMAFTGQSEQQMLGIGWMDAVHPDDFRAAAQWWTAVVSDGAASSHEHRIRRHDGQWRWMLVYAAPLRDASGQIVEWSGMCIDVTERKQAEAALARNAALFRNIIERAPGGMYVVDAQFRLAQVNAHAMPVFESVQPLIGRDFAEVINIVWGPDVGARCAAIFRHTLATGERYLSKRFSEQRHDIGQERAYEWQIERVKLPDGQHGVVCYFQDISERLCRERNMALLVELQEVFDAGLSAEDIMRAVSARLGHALQLTHCAFGEADAASAVCVVIHDHHASDARDLAGTYRIADFHTEEEQRTLLSQGVVANADVRDGADTARAQRFASLGVRAFVHAACGVGGPARLALLASCDRPRAWLPQDIELVSDVAERVHRRIERARAEASLRESQERLRLAVEASSTGLWTWNLASDAVTWSSECYKIHGLPEGTFAGTGAAFFRLVHPEDRARVEATVRAAIDSGHLYECEFRIVRPGGTVVWVVNRGRCSVDASGRAFRMLGTITDVSDRKQADAQRQAGEENLRLALSAAKAGAWGWDVQSGAITWSPENFVLYGIDPAEGPPTYADWAKHIHPDDIGPANEAVQEALAARTSEFRCEFRVLHPLQGTRWLLGLGRVEFDGAGVPLKMTGINLDITERKRFESTLAAQDQRKDEFLATLAHELRNPLAPIRNGLALLKRARLDDAAERLLAMMDRQVGHLTRLVDDLLDVARVSQGKITLKREPVAVSAAVEAAVEACRPTLDAKGHALAIAVDEPSPVLDADRTRLVQVLANLLTNAAKYSPPGSLITVSGRRDGGVAEIAVTDTGMGIAPETLPFVWNMFTQAQATLEQAQGGLGIGLSLVKKLVEMHGGTVAATSEGIGRGSTFAVRLPLGIDAKVPTEAPARLQATLQSPALRILVVDDNVDAAVSLSELLRLFGNEVRTANDGYAGFERAREFSPDVMLCDIGMPKVNGYEVARLIRAQTWGRNMVLVALTGFGDALQRGTSRDAGFDGHLVKPVDVEALMSLVLSLRDQAKRSDARSSSSD